MLYILLYANKLAKIVSYICFIYRFQVSLTELGRDRMLNFSGEKSVITRQILNILMFQIVNAYSVRSYSLKSNLVLTT